MTTESDRELLELAAKAAGLRVTWEPVHSCYWVDLGQGLVHEPWEPLKNDGQALRLAVKLRLAVNHYGIGTAVMLPHQSPEGLSTSPAIVEESRTGPYAATRRAIVRAAAAITRATHKEQT